MNKWDELRKECYGKDVIERYQNGRKKVTMYDSHIFCWEYKALKDQIVDIVNGDIEDYDIDALAEHIQELYDDGEMSSSQYDDLMSYIQDLQ